MVVYLFQSARQELIIFKLEKTGAQLLEDAHPYPQS
jgi:hypothetical protein